MNLNRHRGKVFSIQLDVCIFRTITRSIIYMKICRKNSDEKGQPEERLMNAAAVFEVGYSEIILPLVVATIYLLFFLEIYIRSCSIHGTHIWSTTRFSVCMFNLITFIERESLIPHQGTCWAA